MNASDTAVAEFIQDHWVMNSHWSADLGDAFIKRDEWLVGGSSSASRGSLIRRAKAERR